MAKIEVRDIALLDKFLSSILRFVSDCKFEISTDGCTVRSCNDSKTVRAFFTTDNLQSDESIEFCIGDINRMHKSIRTLSEFKEGGSAVFNYDGTFVKLNDVVSFKLRTVKEEKIAKWLTDPLKVDLNPIYGFKLSNVMMKKLCNMSFISSNDIPKVYIYKKDDFIVGEIDEKEQAIVDSICIPISKKFEGDWDKPLIMNLDSFRTWNLLDAPEASIFMTAQGAVMADSKIEMNGIEITIKVISSVLRK